MEHSLFMRKVTQLSFVMCLQLFCGHAINSADSGIDLNKPTEDFFVQCKKYQFLVSQLGLLKSSHHSSLHKILKYAALPVSLGSWWAALIWGTDDGSPVTKEQAWAISFSVALATYLAFELSGDHFANDHNEKLRSSLTKFLKDWDNVSYQIPLEMFPLFKFLHNSYEEKGRLDIDDSLIAAVYTEVVKRYVDTMEKMRALNKA
jgi:hypothetical protein